MTHEANPRLVAGLALSLVTLGAGMWVLLAAPTPAPIEQPALVQGVRVEAVTPPGSAELPRAVDSRPPSASEVAGIVIDREDGPLAEGQVELACPDGSALGRAPIDESGSFRADGCAGGITCVRLIHPTSIQSEAWLLESGSRAELSVDPRPRLLARVRGDGQPIGAAAAIVRVGEARWTALSDAEGGFAIALAFDSAGDPCTHESPPSVESISIMVQADGWRAWTSSLARLPLDELEIELEPPLAGLVGRLHDDEGLAFSRARVIARSDERPDEAHSIVPDEQGDFAFTSLASGTYSLLALRDGIELARARGSAGDELDIAVPRSARGVRLELELLDSGGDPLVHARVDGGPFRAAWTDEQGVVAASDVFAGNYELRVRAEGCGVAREAIDVEGTDPQRTIRRSINPNCPTQ